MENSHLEADAERLAYSLGRLPDPVVKPAFVVVSGLPGTGKSYFAGKLAERLPFVVLESDALRKTLFSPPHYSADESAYLFRVIHRLIEKLLDQGIPVILDATNLSERNREYLYDIAEHTDAKLILVWVEAPPEIIRQRLEKRVEEESPSDANWAVYLKMKPTAEKIRRRHYVVDTSRDISPVIDKIVKEIDLKVPSL